MLTRGLVQVYTGDGKGKTTAALGLALRAAGQGNRVLFCQFLKPSSLDLGERKAIAQMEGITLRIVDAPWDMRSSLADPAAVAGARKAVADAIAELEPGVAVRAWDVVILDEIVYCLSQGLADLDDLKRLIAARHENVEIILTGRSAPAELIELADLVTEMKSVKHPFDSPLPARRGIEY